MISKRFIIGIAVVGMALGAWYLYGGDVYDRSAPDFVTASPAEFKKLVVGTGTAAHSSLLWIAQRKGFFTENGLTVLINQYEAGKFALANLLNDLVDIAASSEFAFAANKEITPDKFKIIASTATTNVIELIAKRSSGIRDISDLAGKRIGVTEGTDAEFFLAKFLTSNKLDKSDIEIVALPPFEIVNSMLINDKIDAAMIWEPHATWIKRGMRGDAIFWDGQGGQKSFWVLSAAQETINGNADALDRFLRAMVQAEKFVKENPDKAQHIIQNHHGYRNVPVKEVWEKLNFEVAISKSLVDAVQEAIVWAEKNVSSIDYIHAAILAEIKPEAVNVR